MLDPYSRNLIETSSLPSQLPGNDARDIISSAYIDWLKQYALRATDRDQDVTNSSYLNRLSLASSLLYTPGENNRTPTAFVVAEASDVGRMFVTNVDDLSIESQYGHALHILDTASFFHLCDYDANARVLSKDAHRLLSSINQNEVEFTPKAGYSFHLTLSQFLMGRLGDCRAESLRDVDPRSAEERAYHFLKRFLANVSRIYGGGEGPSDIDKAQLLALRDALSGRENPYHELAANVDRLIDFEQNASRKALFPLIAPLLDREEEYLVERISADNNEGYPFAWPPVQEFCRNYFGDENCHAVITVPTGGGKSFLAELAAVHALRTGWVLYLAPTNALCAQTRKDLNENLRSLVDTSIEAYFGNLEYTLERPSLQAPNNILVTTPEKALLFAKLAPDRFETCSLLVLDECHILGEKHRGEITETVLALSIARNPDIRIIMMSALVSNDDFLATWLTNRTNKPTIEISSGEWRPTRTNRITVAPNWATRLPIDEVGNYRVWIEAFSDTVTPWDADTGLLSWLTNIAVESDTRGENLPWVNVVSRRIAEELVDNRLRTLIFVLKSKHHAFSIADRFVADLPERTQESILESDLYELANYELGALSIIRNLVNDKGIAVHTAAMLDCEKRVAEYAFQSGRALVMAATGTLSQGLNLAAEAVVIAGTQLAEYEDLDILQDEREQIALKQVLNAMGRAARANIAIRGPSIIVPDDRLHVDPNQQKNYLMNHINVLSLKDASVEIASPIRRQLASVEVDDMDAPPNAVELHLLSRFPHDHDMFRQSIRISLGAFEYPEEQLENIIERLVTIKTRALESGINNWVMDASSLAGFSYLIGENLFQFILSRDDQPQFEAPDDTYTGWSRFLISWLRSLHNAESWEIIKIHHKAWRWSWGESDPHLVYELEVLGYPQIITSEALSILDRIWNNLENVLAGWFNNSSYLEVGELLVRRPCAANRVSHRTDARHYLPRTIIWSQKLIQFLSRYAGLLLSIYEKWLENDPESFPEWLGQSLTLPTLPLGIRFGVVDPETLACYRNIIRERRAAHLIRLWANRELEDKVDKSEAFYFASGIRHELISDASRDDFDPMIPVIRRIIQNDY